MNTREFGKKAQRIFIYAVFVLYIMFLFKLLILSRVSFGETERSINLIPFKSIGEYLFSGDNEIRRFSYSNIAGNLLAFVPLGVYIYTLSGRLRVSVLTVVSVSFGAELIQGIFGLGAADIDDLILNSLGGLIGIFACMLLRRLLNIEKRLYVVLTVVSAAGLIPLLYLLFVIQLRL